jgi:hypothetical protein
MEPQHVSTAIEGCFIDGAFSNQRIIITWKKRLMVLSSRFSKARFTTRSVALIHVFIMLVGSAPDLFPTETLTVRRRSRGAGWTLRI